MNDDELRERLRAMPEPTATIDVDAVVADARRRRRPKVIGVGVAAGAACLAFLAPVVVPGLLGPDPVTASLESSSGGGAEEQSAPAGEAPDDDGADTAEQPSTLGTQEESAGTPAACGAVASTRIAEGLTFSFADSPADGMATLLVANDGDTTLPVRIGDVGVAAVDGAIVVAASDLDLLSSSAGTLVEIAPGEVASIDVAVDTALASCGADGAIDGTQVPLVVVTIDSGADALGPALGEPLEP